MLSNKQQLSPIHFTDTQRQAFATEDSKELLKSIDATLKRPQDNEPILRKLEEMKSAALITNQKLAKLASRDVQKMSLLGAELVTIKGQKGDKGDKGEIGAQGDQGERGERGDTGPRGADGKHGKDGIHGTNGKDGETPIKGVHYTDGKDGTDIEPSDIVLKLHSLKGKDRLDINHIRGHEVIRELHDQVTQMQSVGGANMPTLRSNGTALSPSAQNIDFTTNLTATYANGTITIAASGGGGFTTLPPTEIPNGVLKAFTFAAATAQPTFIISDGIMMQATSKAGTVNWTWNNVTKKATMTIGPTDDIIGLV